MESAEEVSETFDESSLKLTKPEERGNVKGKVSIWVALLSYQ
jgi:hypothetical protein